MAERFKVRTSTIQDIVSVESEREKFDKLTSSAYFKTGVEMTTRTGNNPRMENILYAWFMLESTKRKITNQIIKEKALEIHSIVNENTKPFKASDAWIHGFKLRFNIDLVAHQMERRTNATCRDIAPTEKLIALEISPAKYELKSDRSPVSEVSFFFFRRKL